MKTLNFSKLALSAAAAILLSGQTYAAPADLIAVPTDLTIAPVVDLGALRPEASFIPTAALISPWLLATKDYKTFHGSICQPYAGAQQVYFDHHDNGLYNNSTANRTVVCPIVRDNIKKSIGLAVDIYVNNVANQSFKCWVDSRDKFGNTVKWVSDSTTGGGNQTLNIANPDNVDDGNYNLYCSVPAKARLASFRTAEITSTDNNK